MNPKEGHILMTDIVIVAIVTAIPACLATIVSLFNRQKLNEVHHQMNGRLDQLLIISKEQSFTIGKAAGKIEEKGEADARGAEA
jgi:hypothetical protein